MARYCLEITPGGITLFNYLVSCCNALCFFQGLQLHIYCVFGFHSFDMLTLSNATFVWEIKLPKKCGVVPQPHREEESWKEAKPG